MLGILHPPFVTKRNWLLAQSIRFYVTKACSVHYKCTDFFFPKCIVYFSYYTYQVSVLYKDNENITSPTSFWKRMRSLIALSLNSFSRRFKFTMTFTWSTFWGFEYDSTCKKIKEKKYTEYKLLYQWNRFGTLSPSLRNLLAALILTE